MNILHFKYAVEIAKTQSISKAAANLYMGQPNLSRAIKELEEELGISIFARTTKGISVTPEGEEFLRYAKKILMQVEEIENIYKKDAGEKQKFSLSTSRATYVSYALAEFTKTLNPSNTIDILYKETNSIQTINNVIKDDYNLGIVRYQSGFDKHFRALFEDKKINYEIIAEIPYEILTSKDSKLVNKKRIDFDELSQYIEVFHADPYAPTMTLNEAIKAEESGRADKRIKVFERATQFTLLEQMPNAFMWAAPQPKDLLEKYNLAQFSIKNISKVYRDVLIYRKEYKLSDLDKSFITHLCDAKRKFIHN